MTLEDGDARTSALWADEELDDAARILALLTHAAQRMPTANNGEAPESRR